MAQGIYSGVRVAEVGGGIAASYCTKLMADLGAEVVKIEPPGTGDEIRAYGPFMNDIPDQEKSGLFLYLNTNKQSITLAIQSATGGDMLRELLKGMDVLVHSLPLKEVQSLHLSYEGLKAVNPGLVVTSITPYGLSGPYSSYKGYSINCAALGGASKGGGLGDRQPLAPPLSQGAFQTGVSSLGATTVALIARERMGRGQQVEVAEAEVWAALFDASSLLTYQFDGQKDVNRGMRGGGSYPGGYYRCKDGYISVSAPQVAQWVRFLAVMGTPEWSKQPRYRNRRAMGTEYKDEVDALWEDWRMSRTTQEVYTLCREARVPFVPVYNVGEVCEESQLQERGFFQEVSRADTGIVRHPGAPWKMTATPATLRTAAPLLGEHNEMVYGNRLKLSKEELANLRRTGVI